MTQVIGGGVVGLAVARQLAQRAGTTTLLVERHGATGTETSSRNSGVVHAGLHYGDNSLKAALCVRGRRLLYALCAARGVGHARVGKWIVAQDEAQAAGLAAAAAAARDALGVATRWVGRAEAAARGQGVRTAAAALESPDTGIVDAHALALCLRGLFEDAGGVVALRAAGAATPRATATVTAETLVNAAGLGAVAVHNIVVPPARRRRPYFAKGTYFAYAGPPLRVSRLVYPAPAGPAGPGLGTHLTLDLAGAVRFGPDVEWVDGPHCLAPSAHRLAQAARDIRQYLPALDPACLRSDYAGIRPKLSPPGHGFDDFVIRKEPGYHGWVNLLGIESPGLTSCLAIAERVDQLLHGSAA